MKVLKDHPFMDLRTVCAFESDKGTYVQVYDVRDLFHGNYSVEVEVFDGGLDLVFSSPSKDRCIEWAKAYASAH